MTQTMLDPIAANLAQPEPHFAYEKILQLAKAIARLSVCDQGVALAILFDALEDEGIDVQDVVPCVLSHME